MSILHYSQIDILYHSVQHRTAAAAAADNTSSLNPEIMMQSCRAEAFTAFVSADAVDVLIKWI